MLKKLTYKHQEIMRRLVVGQDVKTIEQELNVSAATINRLKKDDPLFMSELSAMQQKADSSIVDSMERLSVIERLEEGAFEAIDYCRSVLRGEEAETSVDLKLKTAWDVLDRTNHGKTEKKIVGVVNAADMIISAYKAKHAEVDKEAIIDV